MKILITGDKGYIGIPLSAYLKEKHEVFGYDLRDGHDILDLASLNEACEDMEVIIHLAAIPQPIQGKEFLEYLWTNVLGTAHVCKAAKGKRLIFTSSEAVYGESGGDFGAYGTSKLLAEQVVQWHCNEKLLTGIILRLKAVDVVLDRDTLHSAIERVLTTGDGIIDVPEG